MVEFDAEKRLDIEITRPIPQPTTARDGLPTVFVVRVYALST